MVRYIWTLERSLPISRLWLSKEGVKARDKKAVALSGIHKDADRDVRKMDTPPARKTSQERFRYTLVDGHRRSWSVTFNKSPLTRMSHLWTQNPWLGTGACQGFRLHPRPENPPQRDSGPLQRSVIPLGWVWPLMGIHDPEWVICGPGASDEGQNLVKDWGLISEFWHIKRHWPPDILQNSDSTSTIYTAEGPTRRICGKSNEFWLGPIYPGRPPCTVYFNSHQGVDIPTEMTF